MLPSPICNARATTSVGMTMVSLKLTTTVTGRQAEGKPPQKLFAVAVNGLLMVPSIVLPLIESRNVPEAELTVCGALFVLKTLQTNETLLARPMATLAVVGVVSTWLTADQDGIEHIRREDQKTKISSARWREKPGSFFMCLPDSIWWAGPLAEYSCQLIMPGMDRKRPETPDAWSEILVYPILRSASGGRNSRPAAGWFGSLAMCRGAPPTGS